MSRDVRTLILIPLISYSVLYGCMASAPHLAKPPEQIDPVNQDWATLTSRFEKVSIEKVDDVTLVAGVGNGAGFSCSGNCALSADSHRITIRSVWQTGASAPTGFNTGAGLLATAGYMTAEIACTLFLLPCLVGLAAELVGVAGAVLPEPESKTSESECFATVELHPEAMQGYEIRVGSGSPLDAVQYVHIIDAATGEAVAKTACQQRTSAETSAGTTPGDGVGDE